VTEGMLRPDRYSVDRDILPIFVVTSPEAGQRLVSFQGTGFLIGKQVFVTIVSILRCPTTGFMRCS
jgi:hypothetical protein